MNYGLVLAGGLATRLPNKPLLPMRNHEPVIISSIDFLKRSDIKDISVVVPSNSMIPLILKSYCLELSYIEQHSPLGVPKAISLFPHSLEAGDNLIIVYSDNIYPDDIIADTSVCSGSYHSIITIDDPVKNHQLSKYSNGQWLQESASPHCIAGYMSLSDSALEIAHQFKETTTFLNTISADPIRLMTDKWWDIGTVATYREYWETK